MKRIVLLLVILILGAILFACAPKVSPVASVEEKPSEVALPVAKEGWEIEWEKTLQAARKEGRVTLYTGYGPNWRKAFAEVMAKKYFITLDWVVSGRTSELMARLMTEQRNKIYIADVTKVSSGYVGLFQLEGILQPLEKMLILSEVVDPKAWYWGQLTWLDPDEKTIFVFRNSVSPPIVINTDLVKPGELKSWNDLLDPKWKGRILLNDPTLSGGGQSLMSMLGYKIKGWDFVHALLEQEPMVQRDTRLIVEWVARGKYAILLGPSKEEVYEYMQAGAPIKYFVPSEGTFLSQGGGSIAHLKSSPHPNAAKIFINFLLSREGQTLSQKMDGYQSARVDVLTEGLDPDVVRQPGMKYITTMDKDWREKEDELRKETIKIFEAYLRK